MLTGRQTGYPTPDPKTFTCLEDIWKAYLRQVDFVAEKAATMQSLARDLYRRYMPMPFTSPLLDGCIERGEDCTSWTYHSRHAFIAAGNTNVADSLTAIKKFVFDEKRLTLEELIDALKTNFEGKEDLRQQLINEAPKFGNDDDYADSIAKEVAVRTEQVIESYKDYWGNRWTLDGSMAGGYYFWGKHAAASADGRKHRDSCADAILSPMAGRDHKGPTAVIKSTGKVPPICPFLTNQKFLPQFLEGENKERFAAYLKTWAELGNYQVQFNVVGKEILLDAQVHPEKHANLIVRVAGFSAYFVDLNKGVQDDIIARASQSF